MKIARLEYIRQQQQKNYSNEEVQTINELTKCNLFVH